MAQNTSSFKNQINDVFGGIAGAIGQQTAELRHATDGRIDYHDIRDATFREQKEQKKDATNNLDRAEALDIKHMIDEAGSKARINIVQEGPNEYRFYVHGKMAAETLRFSPEALGVLSDHIDPKSAARFAQPAPEAPAAAAPPAATSSDLPYLTSSPIPNEWGDMRIAPPGGLQNTQQVAVAAVNAAVPAEQSLFAELWSPTAPTPVASAPTGDQIAAEWSKIRVDGSAPPAPAVAAAPNAQQIMAQMDAVQLVPTQGQQQTAAFNQMLSTAQQQPGGTEAKLMEAMLGEVDGGKANGILSDAEAVRAMNTYQLKMMSPEGRKELAGVVQSMQAQNLSPATQMADAVPVPAPSSTPTQVASAERGSMLI